MAAANTDSTWERDEVADANPDLTRKRQRLSEETETSPLSSDDAVVIEALPPDETGSSLDTAIQLDDDVEMASFKDTFDLQPDSQVTPIGQLDYVQGQVLNNSTVLLQHFHNLCSWIDNHTKETVGREDLWQDRYLEEQEFFTKLGQLCCTILEREEDLIRRREITETRDDVLYADANNFCDGLHDLSLRMLKCLPIIIDKAIARRDSGLAKTRQHIDYLVYVVMLAQTLCNHRAQQLLFFKDCFGYKPNNQARTRRQGFLQDPEQLDSLVRLLQQLAEHQGELANAWDAIDAILRIVRSLDLGACREVQQVMDICHKYILPVICDKHPRALPDGFHELSISLTAGMLEQLVSSADIDQVAAFYDDYIKSDHDALLVESIDTMDHAKLLQNVSGGEGAVLIELMTTAWTLAKLKSFIYSDIMDVRSNGILLLSQRLLDIFNAHHSAKEAFEHPVLKFVARFMRTNEVTKYIFGPNSHASLVSHSQNIIGFLAATLAYTNLETDIIWHACTNSVETEFVKASFTVLADVSRYLDLDHLLYMANKYPNTPPSKLGKDAVDSLTNLFNRVQLKSDQSNDQHHRLATAFISIDILMRISTAQEHPSLIQLRETARNELCRFTAVTYTEEDRLQIYSRCIPRPDAPIEHATTSIEIMSMFLNSSGSPQVAQELLSMWPIQAAVDELARYVESQRDANAGSQQQYILAAISARLDFIVRLMALPGAELEDKALASLFRYTFGDLALNNVARDRSWHLLMAFSSINTSLIASDLIRRFLADYAIDLALEFVTPQFIKLLGTALQRQTQSSDAPDDYSAMLKTPAWQKLVQAAESPGVPEVSRLATAVICDMLFEYPRRSQNTETAITCQADFARHQIDHICQDFAALNDLKISLICQKLHLLDAVLQKSRDTAAVYQASINNNIDLATEPEDELFTCTLQIYCGGRSQPKIYKLRANNTTTVAELTAALPPHTGTEESRIIVGGKALDLVNDSDKALRNLGDPSPGVIMICPKHSLQSDLRIVLTSPGAVEQQVLGHFDDLQKLLDGPNDIAVQAYGFLAKISPPTQARQRVASPDTSLSELFPNEQVQRCRYSLHVLSTHLNDFARIGVADEDYITQGIRRLVAVLTDSGLQMREDILGIALQVLTKFLEECPDTPTTAGLIEDPNLFVERVIDMCFSAVQVTSGHPMRSRLADVALQALLQAFRRQYSVWESFSANACTTELHRHLLLETNPQLLEHTTTMISNFCKDESSPIGVADLYTRIVMALVPSALNHKHQADQFFKLATNVVHANKPLQADEDKARELLQSLISTLWQYGHAESASLPILDLAMLGLLQLIKAVVRMVKSFKKPLAQEGFATHIMGKLLFPPLRSDSRPLIDDATRSCAYDLVQASCESQTEFASVMEASVASLQNAGNDPLAKFPGLASWVRPATKCCGLPNLGMTCYMNSLLQQLFANVAFRKFIFEVPIVNAEKQRLLYEVQLLFARMQNGYNPTPDTSSLANVLGIQTDSQEDVHGFYEDLLSRLEANMPDDAFKTSLGRFFTGKQISQIKGECGHVSPRTEPFVDLPIIVKNKSCLPESLDEFVQGEPMQGANRYKCQACDPADGGRLVDAMKRACPDEIPDNLTFCLKRFTFEAMLGLDGKVNDRFDFPQTIDMSKYKREYLDNPESKIDEDTFELVGVIVHQGTLHLGHYWSYTLLRNTAITGSRVWVKLEDRNVSLVQDGLVEVQRECFGGQRFNNGNERADNAYVLFYQRKGSLEEQLALPGPVVDPVSKILLPPRVPVPTALSTSIQEENAWRFRIAHVFHDDFSRFAKWLLETYKTVRPSKVDAPASTESDSQTDSEASATSLESNEIHAADDLVQKVSEFAMAYLQRVAVCDPVPSKRLVLCIEELKGMIEEQPDFATQLINIVLRTPKWFEGVIQHDNKEVRAMVSDFVIYCLRWVQNHDVAYYPQAFDALCKTHSQLTSVPEKAQNLDWEDYLRFAANLASFGPKETSDVLDEGYWEWTFDLLQTPYEGSLRKTYPGVSEILKLGRCKASPLFDFIHSILDRHVDLLTSCSHPTRGGPRQFTQDGLLLHSHELRNLAECSDARNYEDIFKWMRATRYAGGNRGWREAPAGKLVGLLSSSRVSDQLAALVKQSLVRHTEVEDQMLVSLVHMVMNFCDKCQDKSEAKPVFHTLAKSIPLWEGSEGQFVEILGDAFKIVPYAVVSSIDAWSQLLNVKSADVREKTATWLQEDVFNQTPISDSSDVDAERVSQARKLVSACVNTLKGAFDQRKSRSRYEYMIKLVRSIEGYLRKLGEEFSALGEDKKTHLKDFKLRVEVDEARATIAMLERLEAEVMCEWIAEPVVSDVTLQDVRASVEASDYASSEWDEEDDDASGFE